MTNHSTLRQPPHNVELEQAVLSPILDEGKTALMDEIMDIVEPHHFYLASHQLIFEAMIFQMQHNSPVDAVSIVQRIQEQGNLEAAGGIDYIVDMVSTSGGPSHLTYYAKRVKDKWLERQLISIGHKVADIGYNGEGTTEEKIHEAQGEMMKIGEEEEARDLKGVNKILAATVDLIDQRSGAGDIIGVSTGFGDLDQILSGMGRGDLVIVAGRPSMGKTTLAMNIAENVAIRDEVVLGFSLEMPNESLMMRSISSVGKIRHDKVRRGQLGDEEWPSFNQAVAKLKDKHYYLDDSATITTTQIMSKARRMKRKLGRDIDLIVIDYLQLLADQSKESETVRMTHISRNLKQIAKELNCPVIAVSQLNREVDKRTDKRPKMSDLRGSGSVEQDADDDEDGEDEEDDEEEEEDDDDEEDDEEDDDDEEEEEDDDDDEEKDWEDMDKAELIAECKSAKIKKGTNGKPINKLTKAQLIVALEKKLEEEED